MEDEIDLREYIDVLVKHWRLVISIPVVSAVVAALLSFFVLSPVYEAKTGVVILRAQSLIAFEPKFQTLETLEQAADVEARRQALTALAESSAIATKVIEQAESILPPEDQRVEFLLERVKSSLNGDLIEITVEADTPDQAAALANLWGQVYEEYINELYGRTVQRPDEFRTQAAEAKGTYQAAEEALAQFLGDNQIDYLQREVAAAKNTLTDYYNSVRVLDRLVDDTRAFYDQLGGGSGSSSSTATGNSLSIVLLKTRASTLSSGVPAQLQLTVEQMLGQEDNPVQQAQETAALIAILEARRDEIQTLLGEGALQQELLALEEQLERERARQRALIQDRDLTWETYTTVARKAAEVDVAAQVQDVEVRSAVPAVRPEEPVRPKKVLNVAVAGALGLMVGVAGAFIMEYLEDERGSINRAESHGVSD